MDDIMDILEIKDLSVELNGRKLLHNINMCASRGARHLLRGKNGGGKTTLVSTIAGAPEFKITHGKIIFDGADITNETATNRALRGIFLGAQNVPEIPGLSVMTFLKHSCIAHAQFETGRDLSMGEFLAKLDAAREQLNIPREWLNRGVNVGFSGGERKRLMLLQLIMTAPKLAVLDEPDSGADAATQQQIIDTISAMPETTFIVISHQQKFIDSISPTAVTTISDGKIMGE